MRIEFLWFDECQNHDAARSLLDAVLAERGIAAPVESVNVPDVVTGERVRFPGSPTIRVNGVDVDPGYADEGDYTPRCRVYATSEGCTVCRSAGGSRWRSIRRRARAETSRAKDRAACVRRIQRRRPGRRWRGGWRC